MAERGRRGVLLPYAFLCAFTSISWCSAEADFYVAPSGDDAHPGTRGRPFATLRRAQEAVRELKARDPGGQSAAGDPKRGGAGRKLPGRRRPITVLLRGGRYELDEPLRFGPDDSGTEAAPVVYAACGGETPVLSGGVRLGEWRVSRGRWRLTLPEVRSGKWRFSQLFVDGIRRYRPRAAGGRYLFIKGAVPPEDRYRGKGHNRFRFRAGDIRADWKSLQDVEVLTFHSWSMSRLPIASVDAEKHVVTLRGRTWSDRLAKLARRRRHLVENVYEELDEPGEWYLDKDTGELTYIPMPGESPQRLEVVAPKLDRLVILDGAEHLTFRGLAFMHTNWNVPQDGYSTAQAESPLWGAISGNGARHCALERCTVAHVGVYAIEWGERCRDCRVEDCELWDLGAGGVKIGTGWGGADKERIASLITVRDCLIAHGGRMHPAAVGVWIGHSPHNVIEHNDIFDFYYTGVSVGWKWSYGPSHAHHNTIAWNHIHHIGQGRLDDMGGIYTLGESPGTTIHHNVFHDVERVHYGGWGIYFDQATSEIVAENNLVYDTEDAPFNMHWGARNTVRNNVFALGRNYQIGPGRTDKSGPLVFERNIVYATHGNLMRGRQVREDHSYDHNVYWSVKGDELKFAKGKTLAEWRKRGQDVNSIVADPLFKNPEKRDFALRTGSPAINVGFRPFDVSTAGRRTDAKRPKTPYASVAELPKWSSRHRRSRSRAGPPVPHAYPEATEPGPDSIEEGFEETALGAKPPDVRLHENNEREVARVTGEAAVSGKFSLKVTDGPGPGPSYNPHFYYNPGYKSGTLEGGFAIRLGLGAAASHGWRDWPGGGAYKKGPSLRFEPEGTLKAGGRALMKLPHGRWIRIEITCGLGEEVAGGYTLTVKLPGRKPKRFENLPCDAGFKKLDWMGWTASGTQDAVFYLDDVYLRPRK